MKDFKVLTSYIKLCYVYVNSVESIKVAHFQKLTNQSMLNGALVLEMINNFFSESKKNFLIEKRETFQKNRKKRKKKKKCEKRSNRQK